MGRGNCCVTEPYEGLFYVDNRDLRLYHPKGDDYWETSDSILERDIPYPDIVEKWEYDELASLWQRETIEEFFSESFKQKFPSFRSCGKWISQEQRAILENKLFYVALEDNEWSLAVELIQKQAPWPEDYAGLQRRHYKRYLDGIRDALFDQFDELGVYAGPWTSGKITKDMVSGMVLPSR